MKIKNETLNLVVILFTFCAIGAFVLAGVNAMTAPKIEQIEKEKMTKALKFVAPNATDFKEITVEENENGIKKAYTIVENTANTGYCVLVESQGFGGVIKLMVGVTNEGSVLGVDIISLSETPGLGTKADNEDWLNQYVLKSSPLKVVKGKATDENDIVAVSGATVTSKAVTKGVEAAIAFVGGLVK